MLKPRPTWQRQHQRAVARYGGRSGLRFVLADAVTHLQQAEPYDLIYCIHSLAYIDPGTPRAHSRRADPRRGPRSSRWPGAAA